jgi:hypothetical protein
VLGAVPGNALFLSAADSEQLAGLSVTWQGALAASDKIGAVEASSGSPVYFVFEFFQDADMIEARQTLSAAGVDLKENPDLRPWQLLGVATVEMAQKVASNDALLYIFPASPELIGGQPAIACGSAVREDGLAAAIAAGVGDGWDGEGKGAASLTYSFGPLTRKLPEATVRETVLRALAEWRKYARLTFTETPRRNGERNIDIFFGSGAHGDSYPFDGRGGVLAHTFYPAPPNSEPIAGDMHLDDEESWDGAMDLYSVVLHELGHALGLGHSGDATSVMYPFYRKVTGLAQDDIASIQLLYAAQTDSLPPAVDRLAIAVDGVPNATTAATVALSGKATGGADPVSIAWTTDAGAMGAGRGGRDWSILAVPLNAGSNRINITATSGTGERSTQTVTVERRSADTPVATPTPTPAAAPQIQFVEPAAANVTVTSASLRIRGTASQASGIASVSWRNARTGASGFASGTSSWELAQVALQSGANVITVEAKALDGSVSSKSVTVTLAVESATPPPTPTPGPSGGDTTAPTLVIASPLSTSITTTAAEIAVSGTARDNVGVAYVKWSSGSGSGTMSGTASWSGNIPLLVGMNNIVIRAYDAAGNSSWRAISVTRR